MTPERLQQARQFVKEIQALESKYGFRTGLGTGAEELHGIPVDFEDGVPTRTVLVYETEAPPPGRTGPR